jgi:carbon storage regulator
MLILSRKEKERIKLGDSIVVTILRVAGDKVRVGIEAPRDLVVLRDELEPFTPAERAQRAGRSPAPRRGAPAPLVPTAPLPAIATAAG